MRKRCEYCGRTLRTGRRYCHKCKHLAKYENLTNSESYPVKDLDYKPKQNNAFAWNIALSGMIIFIISLFSENKLFDLLGIFGLIFGFPLLLGLLAEFLMRKKKKTNISHTSISKAQEFP